MDTRTGAATRLRKERRPTLAAFPALETSIVEVKAHDGLALPVNVILPKARRGRMPVIVAYHGGPAGSSKPWADASRVVILGGSYGGYTERVRVVKSS